MTLSTALRASVEARRVVLPPGVWLHARDIIARWNDPAAGPGCILDAFAILKEITATRPSGICPCGGDTLSEWQPDEEDGTGRRLGTWSRGCAACGRRETEDRRTDPEDDDGSGL